MSLNSLNIICDYNKEMEAEAENTTTTTHKSKAGLSLKDYNQQYYLQHKTETIMCPLCQYAVVYYGWNMHTKTKRHAKNRERADKGLCVILTPNQLKSQPPVV